jgi:hypothetical protein
MDRSDVSTQPKPLLPELWPLTGSYAFFEANIEAAGQVLEGWRRGLDLDPRTEEVTGPLHYLLDRLQPMSLGYRELLVRTESRWIAYFADHRAGADESPVAALAKFLRCRALYITWWPVKGYEALRFQLLADHPTDFLNYERVLHVGRDDGGRRVFTASGTPQPYEKTEAYRARRIEDRLTPRMVSEYSRALGLRPFEEEFFAGDGLLITSRDVRPDLRYTISDQQARYGYTPPSR